MALHNLLAIACTKFIQVLNFEAFLTPSHCRWSGGIEEVT